MEVSLFLAKVFGLYFVIMGGLFLLKHDRFGEIFNDFYRSPAAMMLGSMINIILGVLIVVAHNVWVVGWPVIITIFGYLSLIKGVANFYEPNWSRGLAEKMTSGKAPIITSLVYIALGAFLAYQGFGL